MTEVPGQPTPSPGSTSRDDVGAGRWAWGGEPAPACSSRPAATRLACVRLSHKNRQLGPEPETIAPCAVSSRPRWRAMASSGRSCSAAGCRSLASAAPSSTTSFARSAWSSASGTPGRPRWRSRRAAVELGVDRRGRQPSSAEAPPPTSTCPRSSSGGHQLAAAGAERGAAEQRERHVAAELGGQLEQLGVGGAQVPQPVAGDQRRGGVGAAAGQPAGDRDALVDVRCAAARSTPWCAASSRRGARRRGWCRRAGTPATSTSPVGRRA